MTTVTVVRNGKEFQSPRSGKFVSDSTLWTSAMGTIMMFQSPRSGKFVSDDNKEFFIIQKPKMRFQSPRSGKFVSDKK